MALNDVVRKALPAADIRLDDDRIGNDSYARTRAKLETAGYEHGTVAGWDTYTRRSEDHGTVEAFCLKTGSEPRALHIGFGDLEGTLATTAVQVAVERYDRHACSHQLAPAFELLGPPYYAGVLVGNLGAHAAMGNPVRGLFVGAMTIGLLVGMKTIANKIAHSSAARKRGGELAQCLRISGCRAIASGTAALDYLR